MICLRCGHEFLTKSACPRCSKCRGQRTIDTKKAGNKEIRLLSREIKELQEENARIKVAMDEDFKSVGNDLKSLYRYMEQIAVILKDNGLVPD